MLPSAHLHALSVPDAAGEVEDSGHAMQAVKSLPLVYVLDGQRLHATEPALDIDPVPQGTQAPWFRNLPASHGTQPVKFWLLT